MGRKIIAIATAAAAISCSMLLLIVLSNDTSASDRAANLLLTPIEHFDSIEILPSGANPIVSRPISLRDRRDIQLLVNSIKQARPYQPSHPIADGRCTISVNAHLEHWRLDVTRLEGGGCYFWVAAQRTFPPDSYGYGLCLQNDDMLQIIVSLEQAR